MSDKDDEQAVPPLGRITPFPPKFVIITPPTLNPSWVEERFLQDEQQEVSWFNCDLTDSPSPHR